MVAAVVVAVAAVARTSGRPTRRASTRCAATSTSRPTCPARSARSSTRSSTRPTMATIRRTGSSSRSSRSCPTARSRICSTARARSSPATSTTSLLSFAPDFVSTTIQIGNDFGQMAKNFGTNETLDVTGAAGAYTSTHTVLGAHFKIDNIETDLAFADYQVANVVVQGVGVTIERDRPVRHRRPHRAADLRQDPPHRPRRRDHPDDRPRRAEPRPAVPGPGRLHPGRQPDRHARSAASVPAR